jgi:enamine deaminase RidA (YjgF/YER057c/UK114 family)
MISLLRPEGLVHSPAFSHVAVVPPGATTIFLGGQNAVDESGQLVGGDDVLAQTRQVLANLGATLAAAGLEPADVLKVTVYLTDIDDRPRINPLRQAFFGQHRPASTLVEVSRLAIPGMKVEIEAIAGFSRG